MAQPEAKPRAAAAAGATRLEARAWRYRWRRVIIAEFCLREAVVAVGTAAKADLVQQDKRLQSYLCALVGLKGE
eukprot:scaffold114148_cov18-Tisochrysis_lutea.AAC.2